MDKKMIMLEGKRIRLRLLTENDITDQYEKWINDPEVNRYLESRHAVPLCNDELKRFLRENQNEHNIFFAIIVKDQEVHIGNIKLGAIDRLYHRADVGIMVGDKNYWGKGYAVEAINLITDFAFRKMHLHKLIAGCYASNIGSIKSFQKAGFVIEGVRKDHFHYDGKYEDEILMAIINDK